MEERLFDDGCVMVIGGSGGIGSGVAQEFAHAGTDVAICYHSRKEAAEDAAALVEAAGRQASVHKVDVQDAASVAAALDDACATHRRVHSLVWGAGPLVDQVLLSETSAEQFRRAMEVEVFGFFNAMKAVLPLMRDAGGGSIVHLGSAGDSWWPPRDGLSVAPKATNEALIRGIAREEGRHEIRANSVLVGVIEAGMFLELTRKGVFTEEWVTEVQKNLGLKRWGKPADIGAAATFLCSRKANYITGQQISVSGGYGV
ncbi:SDR family oxidoreductase [Croceicoccus sp. F390]|uniref:SDR family oxidoreductase n=1 Tax=Croceicoccus esteveae TaxID=3075597 RepID=A0ABU2ZEE4_9SPHN|nr:SDR family oxidoreductase [Croceicoccus sp. F390]MDT0574973.1 SDR family oxidoreductase [Croceicoccus sp. F390]